MSFKALIFFAFWTVSYVLGSCQVDAIDGQRTADCGPTAIPTITGSLAGAEYNQAGLSHLFSGSNDFSELKKRAIRPATPKRRNHRPPQPPKKSQGKRRSRPAPNVVGLSDVELCTVPRTFALTFDDGISSASTGREIATYLNQSGARGTFFVNGNNYDCIYNHAPELRARHKAGHLIASHTWGHVDVTLLNPQQLNRQLELVETAFIQILGVKPRFFRPPYGNIDAKSRAVIQARGYRIIGWSGDSGDSASATLNQQKASFVAWSNEKSQSPIILSHETYPNVAPLMRIVIKMLVRKGWKLVTVAECLGEQAYRPATRREIAAVATLPMTCSGLPAPGEL